jgi:hypothetical protein
MASSSRPSSNILLGNRSYRLEEVILAEVQDTLEYLAREQSYPQMMRLTIQGAAEGRLLSLYLSSRGSAHKGAAYPSTI